MTTSIAQNYDCFTRYPNYLLDTILKKTTTLAQHKIVEAVIRKTIGFHKEADRISYNQFEEMTNLSRPSIVTGIMEAIKEGFIVRVAQGQYFVYSLATKLVKSLYQSEVTSKEILPVEGEATSKEILPEGVKTFNHLGAKVVKTFNLQKKEVFKERKDISKDTIVSLPEALPLGEAEAKVVEEPVIGEERSVEGATVLNSSPKILPDPEQFISPPPPPMTMIQRYHAEYDAIVPGKREYVLQNGVIYRAWAEVTGRNPNFGYLNDRRKEVGGDGRVLLDYIMRMALVDLQKSPEAYLRTLTTSQERGNSYDRGRTMGARGPAIGGGLPGGEGPSPGPTRERVTGLPGQSTALVASRVSPEPARYYANKWDDPDNAAKLHADWHL